MKKSISSEFIIILVTLVLSSLVSCLPSAEAAVIHFDEFQITTNPASQILPDINGYNIVWQDNRNGNWDIYMYTVLGAFTPEAQITSNSANQTNPAISGNIIVYEDDRNGKFDIYIYNITSQTETQITSHIAPQVKPAIDGTRIVWEDYRDGTPDIYMYDLVTYTETCVASSDSNYNPAISDNKIAYAKEAANNYNAIHWYDISTGSEGRYSYYDSTYPPSRGANYPAIHREKIVFSAYRWHTVGIGSFWEDYDIFMKNLNSDQRWTTTSNLNAQKNPDIYENHVVYQDNVAGNWEIYLYDLDSEVQSRVTNGTGNRSMPKTWGGRIVYEDTRNGNTDIYMTMVSYTAETTTQPNQSGSPPGAAAPGGSLTQEPKRNLYIPTPIFYGALILIIVAITLITLIMSMWKKQKHHKFLAGSMANKAVASIILFKKL
jgi:beta propeller repeat protein